MPFRAMASEQVSCRLDVRDMPRNSLRPVFLLCGRYNLVNRGVSGTPGGEVEYRQPERWRGINGIQTIPSWNVQRNGRLRPVWFDQPSRWEFGDGSILGLAIHTASAPTARSRGDRLKARVRTPFVEYCRCDQCGHIWTHDKSNPNSPPTDGTVRKDEKART